MKNNLFLFIVLSLIVLLLWNMVILIGKNRLSTIYNELSENPVLVYSYNYANLQALKHSLDNRNYVRETILEKDDNLAKSLIDKYELPNAEEVLKNYKLPNLLTIYYDGTNRAELNSLVNYVKKYDSTMLMEYYPNTWDDIFSKAYDFMKLLQILNAIIAAIIFIILLLIRLFIENKNYTYWRTFQHAGGNINIYNRVYFWHSLLSIVVPLLFSCSLYGGYLYYHSLPIVLPWFEWIIQTITLLAIPFFVRIFLRK